MTGKKNEIRSLLEEAHRLDARAMGRLAIALETRRMRPVDVRAWASDLRLAADLMDAAAAAAEANSRVRSNT